MEMNCGKVKAGLQNDVLSPATCLVAYQLSSTHLRFLAMKMLITGGAGFIGTNAALYFHNLGYKVVIVDNLSRRGVEYNVHYLKRHIPQCIIIPCDVQQVSQYEKELHQSDVILHLAGQTAVTTSLKDPLHDFDNNLFAGVMLLEAIRMENPDAIVLYASTNKVYGNLRQHRYHKNEKSFQYCDETCPLGVDESEKLSFVSPYGCSKGALDQYMLDYASTFNLRTVVFRQSCIYGPFQQGAEDQGWVAHFTKKTLENKTINVFGDGYQVRDLLYVDDLLEAYRSAVENISLVQGMAFNIGGGISNVFSVINVLDVLEKELSVKIDIQYKPERMGDQLSFVSANTSIKKNLGWQPTTPFSQGIQQLLSWQRQFLLYN
ncbi:MAG: NAD-dependent epimerase/dehydratase family protein [Desulfopila sp.]|jgi:CDP-paratose 2-epimerase|nr:NAD-dependent epimerase/dehydratase family protein [Desulfopila sp.]